MASSLSNRLSEHLTCPVCLEKYTDPRELSCQHVYCKMCLAGLLTVEGSQYLIRCPECRLETEVESGDVANLKTNLIIKKLLLEMRTSNGDQSDCEKHMGEPMRLFCETCDQPICQGCAITDHREHKYKSIKRLFLVEKEKVLTAMEEAKLNINCVKSAIQSTEEKEKAVKENSAQLYQDIDSFIAKRVEILQRLRLRMEKDVDDLTQAELKRLGEEKKAFSLPLNRIEKSLEKADQALCRENAWTFCR